MRNITILTAIIAVILLSGCKEQILHNLSEGEANRYLTRLYEAGIEAEKKSQADGSWALSVKKSQSMQALAELSSARLFRRTRIEGNSASGGSMIPSRDAQRFHYERAISQEVEVTLEALTGVLEARVHLNLPISDPLLGSRNITSGGPSGSVLMITTEQFKEKDSDIAKLVSGASGITSGNISVLITPAEYNEPELVVSKEAIFTEEAYTQINQTSIVQDVKGTEEIIEKAEQAPDQLIKDLKPENQEMHKDSLAKSEDILTSKTTELLDTKQVKSTGYLLIILLLLITGIIAIRIGTGKKLRANKRKFKSKDQDFATKLEAISNAI
jgi:type III secretion system YscJ/HrcJ family lipoprotein